MWLKTRETLNRTFLSKSSVLVYGAVLCVCAILAAWCAPVLYAAGQADSSGEELGILVCATREQAEDALKRLRAGWDFGVLAREVSTDTTAADGGHLGRLDPDGLQPQL